MVSGRLQVPESITRPSYVQLQESPWGDDLQIHNTKVQPVRVPKLSSEFALTSDGMRLPSIQQSTIHLRLREYLIRCLVMHSDAYDARLQQSSPLKFAAPDFLLCTGQMSPGEHGKEHGSNPCLWNP